MRKLDEIFVCSQCDELGVAWCDYDHFTLAHCQKHVDIFLADGGGIDWVYPLLDRKVILPDPNTPRPETWAWEMSAPYVSLTETRG